MIELTLRILAGGVCWLIVCYGFDGPAWAGLLAYWIAMFGRDLK